MRLFIRDMAKAYPPVTHMQFQGFSINIENPVGSVRMWRDENSGECGETQMKYPYGYFIGTLGLDGDEVDVFVGPNEDASNVFVVTQLKKPEFVEIDEQKVMLGFLTEDAARTAYLWHYNSPLFYGEIRKFPVHEFREKLKSSTGKLIRSLCLTNSSAKLQKAFPDSEGANMEDIDKSCEHSKSITCEKCNGTHSASDILKGLTAKLLSMSKRARERPVTPPEAVTEDQTVEVTLFGPQVARALHVNRPFETPSVPVVAITPPAASASPLAPDFLTSCGGCGYMHKSISSCPRCATNASNNHEAAPIWRR